MTGPGAEQVDLNRSWARSIGLFVGAWAFVAAGLALLYFRPKGLESGSLKEFMVFGAIAFFALCGVVAGARMLRAGPVISVGPAGIFDRRLSTDWISWEAIPRVGFVTMNKQRMMVLEPAPGVEPTLPLKSGARRLAKLNAGFTGVHGYWVSATELQGGFPALEAAVAPFLPGRNGQEAQGPSSPS